MNLLWWWFDYWAGALDAYWSNLGAWKAPFGEDPREPGQE